MSSYENKPIIDTEAIELNLKQVLASTELSAHFAGSQAFRDVIARQLSILASESHSSHGDLLGQFRALHGGFAMDIRPVPVDSADLVDEINYFSIYIRNTFHKSLEEIINGQINEPIRTESEEPSPAPEPIYAETTPFTTQTTTPTGAIPIHPIMDPNFYPFLTKPKIIPILKRVVAFFLVFSTIFLLVSTALLLSLNGVIKIPLDETGDKTTGPMSA
ncbi:unnamed protein product [Didymodactylos carnosus]|uniref:Uncharacterized protein n=1 Tax=Didymodactylos carnosus TaxID=1234261 RepID=A0A8S2D9P1_9BILA|nr:unnamed protein product [Didymodactylos carnosus]CAF3623131.1 unnamed protein product [Didymodactylos carnosus]